MTVWDFCDRHWVLVGFLALMVLGSVSSVVATVTTWRSRRHLTIKLEGVPDIQFQRGSSEDLPS